MQAQILRCLDYGKLAWGMMFGVHAAGFSRFLGKRKAPQRSFFRIWWRKFGKTLKCNELRIEKN
jgi:hypothetical protein